MISESRRTLCKAISLSALWATGAAQAVLRQFLGTDAINFALVLPLSLGVERRYSSLTQLAKEMEDARVWGGIHFRTADEHGTRLGRQIAEFAMQQFLRPVAAP